MNTMIMGTILSALVLSAATTSNAADEPFVPTVTVKYGDLDVATSQGAAILYRRIQFAADNVCWRMYDSDAAFKQHKDSCLQKVIAKAVGQVNRPMLTAVYEGKYGIDQSIVVAASP
jgi:UrcA family protein